MFSENIRKIIGNTNPSANIVINVHSNNCLTVWWFFIFSCKTFPNVYPKKDGIHKSFETTKLNIRISYWYLKKRTVVTLNRQLKVSFHVSCKIKNRSNWKSSWYLSSTLWYWFDQTSRPPENHQLRGAQRWAHGISHGLQQGVPQAAEAGRGRPVGHPGHEPRWTWDSPRQLEDLVIRI